MKTIVTQTSKGPIAAALLAILLLFVGSAGASASEASVQISKAIKHFAKKTLATNDIKIGHLDKRLRLSTCSSPLNVFLPRGASKVGKSTVGVKCGDRPGWKIYIPVHVNRFDSVVVVKQSLPRGTVIGYDDIEMSKKDLSQLNYGHFIDSGDVIGMQLKRPIQRGAPLSPNNLKPRQMVRRGDIITILAEVHGLTVRVKGNALADGYRGEAIRVKNQRSKRVVQAEVIAPGIVKIRL